MVRGHGRQANGVGTSSWKSCSEGEERISLAREGQARGGGGDRKQTTWSE